MNIAWCDGEPWMETEEEFRKPLLKGAVEFFELLRKAPGDLKIFARIADLELHLLSRNSRDATPWIKIWCVQAWFRIIVKLPEPEAPWPNAYVQAEAHGADQALVMVMVMVTEAIALSGGWDQQRDSEVHDGP